MPELLYLTSFDRLNIVEETELDADQAANATTATVRNVDNVAADDFFKIGDGENAEIKQVQSIAGQVVTIVGNFSFKHLKGTKIYKLRGNLLRVYRAANVNGLPPSDASFAQIGSNQTIQADQAYIEYNDAAGGKDYWYKKTFFNSATATETSLAAVDAIRGGDYGYYAGIDEVIDEAGLQNNKHITEIDVYQRRSQANSEIKGFLRANGYTIPLQTSGGVEYVPPLVTNLERLLAAGYIMTQEYGSSSQVGKKTGADKKKEAYDIMEKLKKREYLLLDAAGNELAQNLSVTGIPNDSTNDSNGPDFLMPIDKKY